jgi:hypothetical protein
MPLFRLDQPGTNREVTADGDAANSQRGRGKMVKPKTTMMAAKEITTPNIDTSFLYWHDGEGRRCHR